MAFNPDKFINNSSVSIANRLLDPNKLASTEQYVDTAMSKLGSLFRSGTTRETGADSFVEETSEYRYSHEDTHRLPEQPSKAVEEVVEAKTPAVESLVYPSTLPHDFRLNLEMMDYKRPTPGGSAKVERSIFISLPLPRELYDNKSISYSADELGLVGSVVDAIYVAGDMSDSSVEGQGVQAGVRAAPVAAGAIAARAAGPGLRALAGITAAGLLNDGVRSAASQMTGAQLNPNLSVTFRGPKLRGHTFTWEFAPHSAEESRMLRKILTEIQARSLPSMTYENSTGILSYPQICQLSLQPETFKFKKAVIENININYAPSGAPAYFQGTNEPVVIMMTMQLMEIEYFLSEDFGGATAKGLNDDILEISKNIYGKFQEEMAGALDFFSGGDGE